MTDLEKAEKLRERADVSFSEAKEALDHSGGDILDALIYLEKQGKSTAPAGGGFYSGAGGSGPGHENSSKGGSGAGVGGGGGGEGFSDLMRRFGRFCVMLFNKGNGNFLDASRGDEVIFSCPVTALVLLILFFFWIMIPLYIISLFFGFRYQFRGADLGRDSVNAVMDGAASVVEDVKKSFSDSSAQANGPDGE